MPDTPLALVLSGGNALGAFLGGAYEVLHGAGLRPALICATSTGAVAGAVIAGNTEEHRVPRLRELWDRATLPMLAPGDRRTRGGIGGIASRLIGVPGVFGPRLPPLDAIHDLAPLKQTLLRLVDFDILAATTTALRVNAIDAATSEEVMFDTRVQRLGPEHILASCALAPDFPPVEIDGRTLMDGSLARNAHLPPEDWLFNDEPRVCLVLDCIDPLLGKPERLDDLLRARQEVAYAQHSMQQIATAIRIGELRVAAASPWKGGLLILHVINQADPNDHSRRSWDYSAEAVAKRWDVGRRAADAALRQLGPVPRGKVTVRTIRPGREGMRAVG